MGLKIDKIETNFGFIKGIWKYQEEKTALKQIESNEKCKVVINIDLELQSNDQKYLECIQHGIANFLGISKDNIQVVSVEKGSVKVVLELSIQAADKLLSAYQERNPKLAECLRKEFGRIELVEMDRELTDLEKNLKNHNDNLWSKLEKIEKGAKSLWTADSTISHYPPWHLKGHADRIINILNDLISKWELWNKLSIEGIFCLLSSVYLHDIGLQYYKIVKKPEDGSFPFESRHPKDKEDYKLIRDVHAKTTARIIKNCDELSKNDKVLEKLNDALLDCRDYLNVIGLICEEHNYRIEEDRLYNRVYGGMTSKEKKIEKKFGEIIFTIKDGVMNKYDWWRDESKGKRKEELIFNTALLQLADTLDMTMERIAGNDEEEKEDEVRKIIYDDEYDSISKLKTLAFYYVQKVQIKKDKKSHKKQILIDYAIPDNMTDKDFRMLRLFTEGLRLKREEGKDCLYVVDKEAEILLNEEKRIRKKFEMPNDVCDELNKLLGEKYKKKLEDNPNSKIFNIHNLPKSKAHLFLLLYHELYAPNANSYSESIIKKIIKEKSISKAKEDFKNQGVILGEKYKRNKDKLINNFIENYKKNTYDILEHMKFVEEWGVKPFLKRVTPQEPFIATDKITGMNKVLLGNEIPFGSCILIEGNPGSGKTTLALQLLENNNWYSSLYYTFEESEVQIRNNAAQNFGWNFNKDSFITCRIIIDSAVNGEVCNNIIKQLIDEVIDKEARIVVLDSISRFREIDSKESVCRENLSALFAILKILGITVICLGETTNPEDILFEEYLADVVIKLTTTGLTKQRYIEFTKNRGIDSEAGKHLFEIFHKEYIEKKFGKDKKRLRIYHPGIVINPRVRPYSAREEKIFVKLFYENLAEKEFNEKMVEEFKLRFPSLEVASADRPPLDEEFESLTKGFVGYGHSNIKIVSIPKHLASILIEKGDLEPLTEYLPQKLRKRFDNIKNNPRESKKMLEEDELLFRCLYKDGECYIYPNYVDIGLLVYRKDLLERINKKPPKTWDDIKTLSNLLKETCSEFNTKECERKGKELLWVFSFPYIKDRTTFMSFFWELVWSFGGEIFEGEKSDVEGGKLKSLKLNLNTAPVRNTLNFMQELIFDKIAPSPYLGDMSLRSVFSRQWSSVYQAMIEQIGIKKNGKIKNECLLLRERLGIDKKIIANNILGLDLIPVDETFFKGKVAEHYTIWCAWCLGIMSRALSPEIGWSLIEAMTSSEKMKQRAIKGAGLPANKSLYNDALVRASNPLMYNLTLKIFNIKENKAIPRSKIPNYNRIAVKMYNEFTKEGGILSKDYLDKAKQVEGAEDLKDEIKEKTEKFIREATKTLQNLDIKPTIEV